MSILSKIVSFMDVVWFNKREFPFLLMICEIENSTEFRGALSLKILQLHGEFAEYTPLQVKKAVTGNGKAAKEQVAFMVKRLLGIKKELKPLDITDAIAIALTHSTNLRGRK